MNDGGLHTTIDLLGRTLNQAASAVLLAAIDAPQPEICERALRALMARRGFRQQLELLGRWHTLSKACQKIVAVRPDWLSGAVRDAILSGNRQLCSNGCEAVLTIREFDLVPTLINAAEDTSNANADLAGGALLELASLLYEDLGAPRDYTNRRDPQLVRQYVVGSLGLSVGRYARHQRRAIVEAYLTLAGRDDSILKRILQDPHDSAFLALVDVLTHSTRPGVMRLALSFLEDPHAPLAAIGVLAHRGDEPFQHRLLAKIGTQPSQQVKANLKRMETISWLRAGQVTIDSLDGDSQQSAMQLAVHSSMDRRQVLQLIERLLKHGAVEGRRSAAAALAQFKSCDANQLVLMALNDEDPEVQACALLQLRERGIPSALARLVAAVDSPQPEIRSAAQRGLAEFSFKRYLAAFEGLSPDVRRSSGVLVRRVDPGAIDSLRQELSAPSRTQRLRGIEVAMALDAVREVEEQLLALLQDEDHFVRVEAALALAHSDTQESRSALHEALADRSLTVQEAAENSLRRLTGVPLRRTTIAESRSDESSIATETAASTIADEENQV